jgi:hypothetical protein
MSANPYHNAYEQARAELDEITQRFDYLSRRKDQLTKLRDMLGTLLSQLRDA